MVKVTREIMFEVLQKEKGCLFGTMVNIIRGNGIIIKDMELVCLWLLMGVQRKENGKMEN